MGKANFSVEFKRDAVAQITERGYPVAEVSKRLGVSPHSLYAWKKKFARPNSSARHGRIAARFTGIGSCMMICWTKARHVVRTVWHA